MHFQIQFFGITLKVTTTAIDYGWIYVYYLWDKSFNILPVFIYFFLEGLQIFPLKIIYYKKIHTNIKIFLYITFYNI